ncbi:hypothetical protein [Thermodesulfatator autotrophicus]|uniref:Uncharacterized protein n=1 Tax=Thermodesulfatator autotrophicus TaxID=1795632 RepID=A0A177EA17_9BACT|nr:hypothetical protein [Thermodesulfatator autotrophicus]OAG27849.1 hypothetical protein TH606_04775 [Thermodesulfatator autotrophicus]
MKKFLILFLGLVFSATATVAMEKQQDKTCPHADCSYRKCISQEEWEKHHKGIPMPEEMRKCCEKIKEHHKEGY